MIIVIVYIDHYLHESLEYQQYGPIQRNHNTPAPTLSLVNTQLDNASTKLE